MFTGLIEDIGRVVGVGARGRGKVLSVRTALPLAEVKTGDSIALDGACLTVEHCGEGIVKAVAAQETLAVSTLAAVRVGRRVHLERAMRLGGRLDGHLVQGHVDGMGHVDLLRPSDESWILWIRAPDRLQRYIASKGSICVDGVSLTVNESDGPRFRVNLVPHTARATHLLDLGPGDPVNLEVDILAKYLERLLGAHTGGLSLEKLTALGFRTAYPGEGR